MGSGRDNDSQQLLLPEGSSSPAATPQLLQQCHHQCHNCHPSPLGDCCHCLPPSFPVVFEITPPSSVPLVFTAPGKLDSQADTATAVLATPASEQYKYTLVVLTLPTSKLSCLCWQVIQACVSSGRVHRLVSWNHKIIKSYLSCPKNSRKYATPTTGTKVKRGRLYVPRLKLYVCLY